MPIYEYECNACKKVHEVMQKFSDPPMETCSDCGASVQKLISLSSFSLKGSGFYTTDYKRASTPKESKEEKPSAAKECASDKGGCGRAECKK